MCIFLCSAVSHGASRYPTLRPGCGVLVALAVITLAQNQHTAQCFSCLCFSACIFGDTEICLRVVQRSQPCRVFPLTQLSSVSVTVSSQACVCVSTSAAEGNIRNFKSV